MIKINKNRIPGRTKAPSRVVGIDVLRIALALIIFMFHAKMHIDCSYFILNPFMSVGAVAMTGFYMLSGYSLYLVYGEHNLIEKSNLSRFYIKRIFSILPLYYIVSILYIIIMGKETLLENLLLFPIEALGIQSTFSSLSYISHNGGTWFISCLILAYVVYPFLQSICKMLTLKQKATILCLLIVIDIWAAIVSRYFATVGLYTNPFYRIIEFACGIIIADININSNHKMINVFRGGVALVVSIMLLVGGISIVRYYLRIDDYMQYNCLALPCYTIMLFSLGSIEIPKLNNVKSISYFGKVSYAFFLSQFYVWPITRFLIRYAGWDNNLLRIFVSLTLCILISIMMYELIQRPLEKYIKPRILSYA